MLFLMCALMARADGYGPGGPGPFGNPQDLYQTNGWAVQDNHRTFNYDFIHTKKSVPVYFRIEKESDNWEVNGLTHVEGDLYACQLPVGDWYRIEMIDHLNYTNVLQTNKNGEVTTRCRRYWTIEGVDGPQPLYINATGANRVPPEEKENRGLIVFVNDNDSDLDGRPDNEDYYIRLGDLDLTEITATHLYGMEVGFSYDSSIMALYENRTKRYPNRTNNNAIATTSKLRNNYYMGYDDQTLYLEGIQPGTNFLRITGPGGFYDQIKVTVVKPVIHIGMDGNRDDEIDFDDPQDTNYLFWVNNDYDVLHYNEAMWQEDDDDPAAHSDCEDSTIGNQAGISSGICERDLEDFTRLHVQVDNDTVALTGVTYWIKFENCSGSPSVNLFNAADPSSRYLSDTNMAAQQILMEKVNAAHIGELERQIAPNYIQTNNQVSPFLLEGCSEGSGDLTFIVKLGSREIGRKSVHLELHNMDWFYDVYKTELASGSSWDAVVQSNATHVQTSGYAAATSERLLYVHGWNMNHNEKVANTETMFKRLWWQGYQGSLALFDWPTLSGFSSAWNALTDPGHFDDSEFRAWQSASALIGVFNTLNNGQLRVLAHSMGNIVAGETLRKYTGTLHTYIASQAAVPAHCYDNTITDWADMSFTIMGLPVSYSITTPNVYGHYYSGDASADELLKDNSMKVSHMYNYHNVLDYALNENRWELNNALKPDGVYNFEYYGRVDYYDASSSNYFCYWPYPVMVTLNPAIEMERYRIFSYCAQSRTEALGTQNTGNFTGNFDLNGSLGYNDEHYSHSKEFRSNIADEWMYWFQVKENCQLIVTIP